MSAKEKYSTYHVDSRNVEVKASPDEVFRVVCGSGGERVWLSPAWLWWLRGILDRVLGGPGLQTKRRHADQLQPGDIVGMWHVHSVEEPGSVVLRVHMNRLGEARLEFRAEAVEMRDGVSIVTQTATFRAESFLGSVYWYLLDPIHRFVFRHMIGNIALHAKEARGGQVLGDPLG